MKILVFSLLHLLSTVAYTRGFGLWRPRGPGYRTPGRNPRLPPRIPQAPPHPPVRNECILIDGQPICYQDVPECLRFVEPLAYGLQPSDIVIFTGGDSVERRLQGVGQMSGDSIEAFAKHHGYNFVCINYFDYDKSLTYKGETFHPAWSRVFAMPSVRAAFPDAKYFVWFDDDVLAPYPETHTLNHYINMMEPDPEWMILYAEEPVPITLNSGVFIMRNDDFSFDFHKRLLDNGAATYQKHDWGWEQDAVRDVRAREGLQVPIKIIKHREGDNISINTFAIPPAHFSPELGIHARLGDAFVHFCGVTPRAPKMKEWVDKTEAWKARIPRHVQMPIDLP